MDNDSSLLLAFTRLEGKVDVALSQHGGRLDTVDKLLTQHIAATAATRTDHEARIRNLEATPTVSPKGLWTAIVSAIAAGGGLFGLINALIK